MTFLESDLIEAVEEGTLDEVFLADDAQQLREAGRYLRVVVRMKMEMNARADALNALVQALT